MAKKTKRDSSGKPYRSGPIKSRSQRIRQAGARVEARSKSSKTKTTNKSTSSKSSKSNKTKSTTYMRDTSIH